MSETTKADRHACAPEPTDRAFGAYGSAVDDCYEDARGFFWASNGEYETPVEFCPFCGVKAPRAPGETLQFTMTIEQARAKGVQNWTKFDEWRYRS